MSIIHSRGRWHDNCIRTTAITLSTTRIRAIATSESPITTSATAKTTTAIVTTMITVTVIIVKTVTKTITRVVETLSTLTMIRVADPARNKILIQLNLETLYRQSNLNTHDFFGQTLRYQCVPRIPADINGTVNSMLN